MLHSMTGFGRGEAQGADVSVVVELRAVNNRFLDLQLRAPREYLSQEPIIARRIKQEVRRGRVEVHVRRTMLRTGTVVRTDEGLLQAYLGSVESLVRQTQRDVSETFALEFALKQPGVLEAAPASVDVMRESEILGVALEAALEELLDMRKTEGKELHADLQQHLLALLGHLDVVEAMAPEVEARVRSRMEQRMERLLKERVDPLRMTQEAAILSEKSDVSEEVARLKSHVLQFRAALEQSDPVGRRLEFLLQEMNREVNTIGSKSSEHPINHRVVDMKAVLEKMREQSANVE